MWVDTQGLKRLKPPAGWRREELIPFGVFNESSVYYSGGGECTILPFPLEKFIPLF